MFLVSRGGQFSEVKHVRQNCYWVVAAAGVASFSVLFRRADGFLLAGMSTALVGLCCLAFVADSRMVRRVMRLRRWPSGIASTCMGFVFGALLYGICVFLAAIARYWLPSGAADISLIYDLGAYTDPLQAIALLGILIAPCEELFWRGYVQGSMERRFGTKGLVPSVLVYSLAHLASGNTVLILAATLCGAYWAFLYWRYRSLGLNIVAHTTWAVAVFILWPLA